MRKNIALLLVLVMLLSLIPMTAFAQGSATYTRLTAVQNVGRAAGFEWAPASARIEVKIPAGALVYGETDRFFVEIPTGLAGEFTAEVTSTVASLVYDSGSFSGGDEIKVRVTPLDLDSADLDSAEIKILLTFAGLNNESRLSGDEVAIGFDSPAGSVFGSTNVVIGRITAGAVTVSMRDINIITDAGDAIGTVRVTEDQAGALNTTMDLKLPRGFYWTVDDDVDTENRWGDRGLAVSPRDQIGTTGNFQTVRFTVGEMREVENAGPAMEAFVAAATTEVGSWDITGLRIKVDPTLARFGEVEATVSGASPSTLIVAVYGDYLAELTGITKPHLLAGRIDQRLGRFEIEELVGGTLVGNRTITMTLPSGVKWDVDEGTLVTPPSVRTGDSDNYEAFEDINWEVVDLAGRTIRGRIDAGVRDVNEPAVVRFNGPRVAIEPGFEGDLTVTFGGSAGIGGELVLAEVTKPVTVVSTEIMDVKLGVQVQAIGDIVITETKVGALERGNTIVLEPVWDGVRFATTPVATVEGDIIIEEIWMAPNGRTITIGISADGDREAAEITISGLFVSLDRVLPEGNLDIEVKGDALVDKLIHSRAKRTADSVYEQNAYFAGSDVSSVVTVARVATPAPDAVAPGVGATVAFTVGSTTYTVNGVPKVMEVEPFISNDRIMIPVRFLEEMFGSQPIWNPGARTVTVLFEGKVFEMAIGSRVIRVNGAPFMEMDAEALIVNERTFVPASRFARAMGVDYSWDETTRTATFN